jgi:AAA domain-containing protein
MVSLATKYTPTIRSAKPIEEFRFSFVVEGPPGTGKSTLCGSMAEVLGKDKVILIATLPREIKSWKYQEHQIDRILLTDADWEPDMKHFGATAAAEFLKVVRYLRDEDTQYDAVILDSGTELAEFGWRAALAPHSVGSPAQMEDGKSRWLPYETLSNYLDLAIKELISLTEVAKRPKYVAVTWHIQPPKDDMSVGGGATKKSADAAGKGVEYEGDVLPMIRGQYRRKLGSQFEAVIFTDMQSKATLNAAGKVAGYTTEYMLQVRPDLERQTKLPCQLPAQSYIHNSFKNLLELVRTGKVPAGK